MTMLDAWSEAIGYTADDADSPSLPAVVEHIRSAVFEAGFVSRGRITSGLKEAYRPFDLDEAMIREKTDAAIDLMLLSGDLEEYATSAGRGYAGTPPRLIDWDGDRVSLLGSSRLGTGTVRQFAAETSPSDGVTIALNDELGRPEWRNALVELGCADAPESDARTLFAFSQALAASGERYSLDEPNAVAVVSGRAEFFGRADPAPSGRWSRVEAEGFYPAAIRTGYTLKNVVLHVAGKDTTLWQPPSRDIWRWIVVGLTLAHGDPVLRYDRANGVLDFLTPPPRQAERAALITGEQLKPWSWRLDTSAYAVIAKLMGSPR
ncbi:hypothetical protein [Rhizorhapis sp. SPR117]|uniref:hypothetical protein n=1 Tax=Rhizorhapis sp. SPR117 TaxID=2912611 RepID=UPI001F47B027|nr:hypothetical protein [Rhizorhapis sp. SPR117]